jgi:hypothetical protein
MLIASTAPRLSKIKMAWKNLFAVVAALVAVLGQFEYTWDIAVVYFE